MSVHRRSQSRGRTCGWVLTVALTGLVSFARAGGTEPANGAATDTAPTPRPVDPATRLRATEVLARQPIRFEENGGQLDPSVRYLARSRGYDLLLAADEARVVLRGESSPAGMAVVRMRPIGGRSNARLTPLDPLPGRTHYLVGNEPSRWRKGLVSYGRVRVEDVYPGVDIVYYGNERELEFDLAVAPGADPAVIALDFGGTERLEVDAAGDLVVHVAGRRLRMRKPLVYQERAGARLEVGGRYVLQGPGRVGFQVGAYDASQTLVIDPVLLYSTYLGGSGDDAMTAVAVDSSGCLYLAGYNLAPDYPTTPGAVQPEFAGGSQPYFRDSVVTKFAPDGTFVYSTYLGGTSDDTAADIAVDSLGRAWVGGYTWSGDFPTPGSPPATPTGSNGWLAQLAADGSALVQSRLLGGSRNEWVSRIVIDGGGSVYVAGSTSSPDFPVAHPVQSGCAAEYADDVFLAKLEPTGGNLVYSTCLGGSAYESIVGIEVDARGNLYAGGTTGSADFPTRNPVQDHLAGGPYPRDAFLAKLGEDGALVYSTYLGGSGFENERFSAFTVDAAGNAYFAGGTTASDFPRANPIRPGCGPTIDPFVTKLDAQGAFVYSTCLWGSQPEEVLGLAVDDAGSAYLTGFTASPDFPTTPGAVQPLYAGNGLAFVTKLSPTGALVYSTFLGGSGSAIGLGLAVDSAGRVLVAGSSRATDFPTPPAGWPPCPGRGGAQSDAFVAKLAADASALVYSACLGGSGYDGARSVILDASGNAYVVGLTQSTDFPTTPGAAQPTSGGGGSAGDTFVARIGEAAPPTVDAGGPYAVGEGGSVLLTALGSDPQDLALVYDWDIDGDGAFESLDGGSTVVYSAGGVDGPSTPTVTVRVTSTANTSATATTTVEVLNVPPTATFTATPAQVIVGQCVTLALTDPEDPGAQDSAAGFRYSFDCDGDGILDVADSPTPTFVCHAAAAPGLSPVAAIADDDGGRTTYQETVVVLTPQDSIRQVIITTIDELVADGVLNQGQGNALVVSANAAIAALDDGDTQRAINVLGALLNKLEADVKTGKIPADVGELLISAVQQTITVLQTPEGGGDGCPAA